MVRTKRKMWKVYSTGTGLFWSWLIPSFFSSLFAPSPLFNLALFFVLCLSGCFWLHEKTDCPMTMCHHPMMTDWTGVQGLHHHRARLPVNPKGKSILTTKKLHYASLEWYWFFVCQVISWQIENSYYDRLLIHSLYNSYTCFFPSFLCVKHQKWQLWDPKTLRIRGRNGAYCWPHFGSSSSLFYGNDW